jgi:hypothetical protein
MNNDIEFNPEDLEFGEFDEQDLDHFEDFDNFEPSEIQMRTAILSKNNMIALLCIKTADEGGAICRVDPREEHPAVQVYDDPEKALDWYRKSLTTSRENGWQVVYDGLPLQG